MRWSHSLLVSELSTGFKNHRVRGDLSESCDSDYIFGEYFGSMGGINHLNGWEDPWVGHQLSPVPPMSPFVVKGVRKRVNRASLGHETSSLAMHRGS